MECNHLNANVAVVLTQKLYIQDSRSKHNTKKSIFTGGEFPVIDLSLLFAQQTPD